MRRFNKIFGIGLSRTGTTSLDRALIALGLKAVHFPQSFADIENHDAASDTPVAEKFEQLDEVFPGSLFVFTYRDVGDWLRSVERLWKAFDQFSFSPEVMDLHRRIYGSSRFDRDLYAAAYDRHTARVKRYFETRPRDLLEVNICAGAGWPELCAFLETPVPAEKFPEVYPIGPTGMNTG